MSSTSIWWVLYEWPRHFCLWSRSHVDELSTWVAHQVHFCSHSSDILSILFIGLLSRAGQSAYSASKFAIEAFSDSLRQEMHKWGVFVSVVEPLFLPGDSQSDFLLTLVLCFWINWGETHPCIMRLKTSQSSFRCRRSFIKFSNSSSSQSHPGG